MSTDIIHGPYTDSKHIIRWKQEPESILEETRSIPDVEPAITPREAYSASYWRYRAARVRSLALRHDGKIQDRLTSIASSYDLLAERAQRVRQQIDEIEAIDGD